MLETFRENQKECDPDGSIAMELVDEFSTLLSNEKVDSAI